MILSFDMFTEVLQSVFHIEVLLAIAIGMTVGLIVGAIPGLTSIMAVSLLLPFSFYLDPLVGIPFLIGVYKGGITGGSIPAILISTPGTGAAAATVLDGYPLAKQGKAGKAIKMSILSSVIGDTISSLATFFLFAFGFTRIALFFGAPEMCALLLLCFSLIAVLSEGSKIKGFISGILGMMLAIIGQDPVMASRRFIFGNVNLLSGFEVVPLMIGIFAVAEVLVQIENFSRAFKKTKIDEGALDSTLSLREVRGCVPTMMRSSFIGMCIGAIPGLGQIESAFLSYAVAKRTSKHPEKFGKGSLEGIAAAETGNNAVNGTTLLPLLTFGIPGDTVTAVLLGAFVAQGLSPGVRLLEENGVVVFGILFSMIVANIFMYLIAMPGAKFFARVATISIKILVPIVLTLCILGCYSVNNSVFDVYMMCFFGIFGYLLKKLSIPPAPLLITFILTRNLELSFAQTLQLSKGSIWILFQRPASLVLMLITFSIIGWSIYDSLRKKGGQGAVSIPS